MIYLRWLLVIGFLCAFFYMGLASYPLLDNNEGLYAEIAREMLQSGNYIIPHLNYLPYLEKPPLLYWLLSFSLHEFGSNAFAARLVTTSAGLTTCLSLAFFGSYLLKARIGWLAAIILATAIGFQIFSREVFFDVLLTACFTCGMACFYLWHKTGKKWSLRLSYAFLGLALLTKGLLSLALAGAIALSFILTMPNAWQKTKQFLDVWGILLFLVITAPWHIAASLMHANFAWYYFVHEQILRFLNLRQPHDYYTGNVFYYLPRLFISFWPWCWLLLAVLFNFKQALPTALNRKQPQQALNWFLWLWFLIPLLFFSCSSAKANYYMVLGMPPLALLLAIQVNSWWEKKQAAPLLINFLLSTLIITIVSLSAPFWLPEKLPQYILLLPLLMTLGCICASLMLLACGLSCYWKKQAGLPIIYTVLLAVIFVVSLLTAMPKVSLFFSQSKTAACLKIIKPQPLYLFEDYERFSSLPFYWQSKIVMVDSQSSDLYYGQQYTQAKWFINHSQLQQIMMQQPVTIGVAKEKLARFQKLFATTQLHMVCKNPNLLFFTDTK